MRYDTKLLSLSLSPEVKDLSLSLDKELRSRSLMCLIHLFGLYAIEVRVTVTFFMLVVWLIFLVM